MYVCLYTECGGAWCYVHTEQFGATSSDTPAAVTGELQAAFQHYYILVQFLLVVISRYSNRRMAGGGGRRAGGRPRVAVTAGRSTCAA